uniref:Uncharacterized protein n=1 Tax=Octopus bimaculoides TaxID=37653 RepID=A0A0L8G827_OCTBM
MLSKIVLYFHKGVSTKNNREITWQILSLYANGTHFLTPSFSLHFYIVVYVNINPCLHKSSTSISISLKNGNYIEIWQNWFYFVL